MSTNIDFIIRIKNGYLAGKAQVVGLYSKLNVNIAEILKAEKYIKGYSIVEDGVKKSILLDLAYSGRKPAIQDMKIFSRPGQRQYVKKEAVYSVHGGLGISIVSTAKGLMTGKNARMNKIGGELLCWIW